MSFLFCLPVCLPFLAFCLLVLLLVWTWPVFCLPHVLSPRILHVSLSPCTSVFPCDSSPFSNVSSSNVYAIATSNPSEVSCYSALVDSSSTTLTVLLSLSCILPSSLFPEPSSSTQESSSGVSTVLSGSVSLGASSTTPLDFSQLSTDQHALCLAIKQFCKVIPPSPVNPYTPLQLTSVWLSEQFTQDLFLELGRLSLSSAFVYKKVTNKTRLVATSLPEDFRIICHKHPDPLGDMRPLPVRPPEFSPTS